MDKRILLFNKHFERWGITLPPDAEQQCPRGTIVSRVWTVKYCFGKDRDGKFLDYYAAHRMTNDRHLRIRANGDVEGLPAYPDALQRWEPEYIERVTKLLEAKGGASLRGQSPDSTSKCGVQTPRQAFSGDEITHPYAQ